MQRIQKNLRLDTDGVSWCVERIKAPDSTVTRRGQELVYYHGWLRDYGERLQLYDYIEKKLSLLLQNITNFGIIRQR